MTEEVEAKSYPFDFITTPLFIDNFNISYHKSDFDGTNKFQMVISTVCPDNIEECINSSGALDTDVVTIDAVTNIALILDDEDKYDTCISIANTVTMNLPTDVDVKGVFLRRNSSPYFVLFAMVNENPVRTNKIIFEEGNELLKVQR